MSNSRHTNGVTPEWSKVRWIRERNWLAPRSAHLQAYFPERLLPCRTKTRVIVPIETGNKFITTYYTRSSISSGWIHSPTTDDIGTIRKLSFWNKLDISMEPAVFCRFRRPYHPRTVADCDRERENDTNDPEPMCKCHSKLLNCSMRSRNFL